jgi:hypothetical protein
MYIQHIQGLCQFGLSTAENALLLVAPATIAMPNDKRLVLSRMVVGFT